MDVKSYIKYAHTFRCENISTQNYSISSITLVYFISRSQYMFSELLQECRNASSPWYEVCFSVVRI
jgi:hypothetical protein